MKIARIGEVHPLVCENYGIPRGVCIAQADITAMMNAVKTERGYTPLPVYPAMERDLALVCDRDEEVGKLLSDIRSYAGKSLESVYAFDIYSGKGVQEGKKSVAVRLVFRHPDRTMTDEETDTAVAKVVRRFETEQGIVLRS